MAGSIPLSLQQVFANDGTLLSGGLVYFIQAGTVGTPQNAFQDSGLTLPWPNPYVLPESARLPLVYFADGYIKIRMTDANGNQVFNQDNIPVTGFSSGGGGGGTVDPTTILQTGQLVPMYGTGIISGFVRAAARTMGNATSGATERANADTSALFAFLYNQDVNLAVSGGRGANAAADYAANKTITLPDFRGRVLGGLGDMGNSDAGRLTSTYFGTSPIVLGAASTFLESRTIVSANLPPYTPAGTNATSVSTVSDIVRNSAGVTSSGAAGGGNGQLIGNGGSISSITVAAQAFTGTAQGGVSTPFSAIQPTMLATIYLKL